MQRHGGGYAGVPFCTKRTAIGAAIKNLHRLHQNIWTKQQAIHLTMAGATRGGASKATGSKQTFIQAVSSKLNDLDNKVGGIEKDLADKVGDIEKALEGKLDNDVLQQLEEKLNKAFEKKLEERVEEMRKAVVVEQQEKEKMVKKIQVGLEEKGGFSSIGQFRNQSVEVRRKIQP